ncbi:MAG: squalene/phytoene synthase family protein [Proteobacteria bacterium]|nr:squalene/phytoene synthase family protein [Pseudomonadota bacterium]
MSESIAHALEAPVSETPSSESEDLDALIRRVDPDRWLSSRFIADVLARADVIALYAFDHELARAPRVASNPLLGEIRLTWWREALDEIFEGRAVRMHPTAQALARVVAARGLQRAPLETMIDARYRELDPTPMSEAELLDWARDTGGLSAQLAAQVLDAATDSRMALAGGSAWSLGKRLADQPDLRPVFLKVIHAARSASRSLSVAAFPAVAHAALAGRPSANDFARRLRLTIAVARGRI